MKRLEGKITVIAGAGCGFGMSRGFPEAFAKEGSHLVLNYYGNQDDEMMNFQTSLEKKDSLPVGEGRHFERGNGVPID